jgi:uncharacterized protein
MDLNIESFITEQKNLSFCTSVNDNPYCASCFYAFVAEGNYLVFKSKRNTKHIANALVNDQVAGTIIPDISKVGTVKGIQLTGKFISPTGDLLKKAQSLYYSKFPFAISIPGEIWSIELLTVKMTNNKLGFGKKLFWSKS